jgi:predicted dehydrogenase
MNLLIFALVGYGRVAKRHSELLVHNQIPDARLAAVCDIKPDRAAATGSIFQMPHYTDI